MIRRVGAKFTVGLRGQLKTAGQVQQFCTELTTLLETELEAGRTPSFDDFDVSQSNVHAEGFEEIFMQLIISEARIERFKAFGCPALNDSVVKSMADWLSRASSEAMPAELHLSDCAITSQGFEALAQALEASEALPVHDPREPERTIPLYVRLERNYIEDACIKAMADQGSMTLWRKSDPMPQDPSVKWRLVVWDLGQFGQNRGPAPVLVDPPSRVAGVKVAPKEPDHSGPITPGPKSSPVRVPPRAVTPDVRPAAKASQSSSPALAKRVMAPKVAPPEPQQRAVAPPVRAVRPPPKKSDQSRQEELFSTSSEGPAPAGPAPVGRVMAPKLGQAKRPQQPSCPPPKRAAIGLGASADPPPYALVPKAAHKEVVSLMRSRAKEQAPLSSKAKAMQQRSWPTETVEDEEPEVQPMPQPPRFPPPSSLTRVRGREKMMAAPKSKMRAKPY